ncbi:MAG: membrane dipeptidase [Arenicella sp.]|jgi:membrane dipeptidase
MKNCITCLIFLPALALAASANAAHHESDASVEARSLAQNSIIMDGHVDVPYRLHKGWVNVTEATAKGDFDYIRAKKGGLNGPFMSIYIPAKLDDSDESTQLAHQLIDNVEAIVGRAPDKFAIAVSADDIEAQFKKGLISLPMGMENGSPIQGNLKNLEVFHKRGIRYITLTHAKSNHISDSSYDENNQWDGLSPFGEKVVSEMNRLGIMVDISHVSDAAFYDAVKISKAPMIASHSSLRSFTPNFERNMDDAMVKALAEGGGVIMINFGSTFLSAQARAWADQQSRERAVVVEKNGEDSDVVKGFSDAFRANNPLPYADVATVVDHIDHAVKLVGIDHVGLGSDYDGVGDSLPTGLKDVAAYPNLIQGLLDRKYSNGDIKKILGSNTLRVWREVEAAAD